MRNTSLLGRGRDWILRGIDGCTPSIARPRVLVSDPLSPKPEFGPFRRHSGTDFPKGPRILIIQLVMCVIVELSS
jgi:hypothetical protein